MVGFVLELLARFRLPEYADLLVAGLSLRRLIYLLDTSPLRPSAAIIAKMKATLVRFLVAAIRGGVPSVPKVHQSLHMMFDSLEFNGNPKYYSIFDESLNKDLAGIAAVSYSRVWTMRIFICWRRVREPRPRGLLIGFDL